MSLFRKGDQLLGESSGVTLGGEGYLRQPWFNSHREYRAAPGGGVSVTGFFGSLASNQVTSRGSALLVHGAPALSPPVAMPGQGSRAPRSKEAPSTTWTRSPPV
jgi:hypothetical protein